MLPLIVVHLHYPCHLVPMMLEEIDGCGISKAVYSFLSFGGFAHNDSQSYSSDNKKTGTLNNYQMVYLIQWLSLHASFAELRI